MVIEVFKVRHNTEIIITWTVIASMYYVCQSKVKVQKHSLSEYTIINLYKNETFATEPKIPLVRPRLGNEHLS